MSIMGKAVGYALLPAGYPKLTTPVILVMINNESIPYL